MTKYFWKQPGLGPREQPLIGRLVRPVEKAIELSVVAVQVTEYPDAARLHHRRLDVLLQEVQLRVQRGVRVAPAPVEVDAGEGRPGVADDDAVGIEHWDQFDDVVGEELVVALRVEGQLVQNVTHYDAAVCLSRVQPRLDIYHLLSFVFHGSRLSSFS